MAIHCRAAKNSLRGTIPFLLHSLDVIQAAMFYLAEPSQQDDPAGLRAYPPHKQYGFCCAFRTKINPNVVFTHKRLILSFLSPNF
jgi:hypothetical protein